MKKILEVLQYGETDIRFNTDIDTTKNPGIILDIIAKSAFTMMTKLWGGNEQSVLAMIRALAIADLSVSVNRKEMIRQMDETSQMMNKSMKEARKAFEKNGGKMIVFGPGVKPGPMKS